MSRRFLISGYYGYRNAGDDAILTAVCANISQRIPDAEITALSYDPALTEASCRIQAVDRFKISAVRRAMQSCDVFVSGGGSLLQDNTSTRSLLYYLALIRYAGHCGKKVMLFANGVGPIHHRANRWLTGRVLRRIDAITVRDESSKAELLAMGVRAPEIIVTADPVFTITDVPKELGTAILEQANIPRDKPLVGVSVRPWRMMEEFAPTLAAMLDRLIRERDVHVVFLPMQFPYDVEISRKVIGLMTEPTWLIDTPHTPAEWIAVTGELDLVLAMRLHSLVFAANRCVPTVGFIYDPKITAFLERLHMAAAGFVEKFDGDSAYEIICAALDKVGCEDERLAALAAELMENARKNEDILLQLLEK